jgi:hypothetical protein
MDLPPRLGQRGPSVRPAARPRLRRRGARKGGWTGCVRLLLERVEALPSECLISGKAFLHASACAARLLGCSHRGGDAAPSEGYLIE